MLIKNTLFLVLTTAALCANPLKIEYAYGVHDFLVNDAFHTLGFNGGIYAEYTTEHDLSQFGYFEMFVDFDREKLDPDHIPVWFRANYRLEKILAQITENFTMNAVVDLDWKMNTVSSIEQYMKAGLGLGFNYDASPLTFGLKVLGGTYYLEIDDDVPKSNGYTRDDLGADFKGAFAYVATVGTQFSENLSGQIEYSEWHDNESWLERFLAVKLNYNSVPWSEKSTIQFSVESTKYNFFDYHHVGKLPILPWDDDVLFKLSVKTPF